MNVDDFDKLRQLVLMEEPVLLGEFVRQVVVLKVGDSI